jgi:SAM-dependent methyltransferase
LSREIVEYWESRFQKEGRIWGDEVSPSIKLFSLWLKENRCQKVLVVGCGYGRGARYLAEDGFTVDAVDTSLTAIRLAQEDAHEVQTNGSTVDRYNAWVDDGTRLATVAEGSYDAIVTDKLWHLFDGAEREEAIRTWARVLRPGGVICCNAFSPEDASYLTGEWVAEQTQILPDGKTIFYATSEQWHSTWDEFTMLCQGTVREEYGAIALVMHFAVVRV